MYGFDQYSWSLFILVNLYVLVHQFNIKSVLNNIKNDPDYGVKGGKTRENIIQDFIDKKAFYSDQLDKLKAEML